MIVRYQIFNSGRPEFDVPRVLSLQICSKALSANQRRSDIICKRDFNRGSSTCFRNVKILSLSIPSISLSWPTQTEHLTMALLFRPAVLRQTCTALSRRTFSTQLTTFPSSNQAASIISRQTALSLLSKSTGSIRVAAFHATRKQAILPALPRKWNYLSSRMSAC